VQQGEVALSSSLRSKWHGLGQVAVIENQDSNTSAAFEAKGAGSALGYWEFFYHLSSLQDYSNAFTWAVLRGEYLIKKWFAV